MRPLGELTNVLWKIPPRPDFRFVYSLCFPDLNRPSQARQARWDTPASTPFPTDPDHASRDTVDAGAIQAERPLSLSTVAQTLRIQTGRSDDCISAARRFLVRICLY
ncbi:hypothetical protein VTK26DRAFT_3901 [Humicola hyalothermophila]